MGSIPKLYIQCMGLIPDNYLIFIGIDPKGKIFIPSGLLTILFYMNIPKANFFTYLGSVPKVYF